ncbi:helix-turn-helix transcriptional regulator [Sandaracinus amylolyticus]|nr:helix-turn-helix transcriptional regulator [Sandaracinus amylolyticus]
MERIQEALSVFGPEGDSSARVVHVLLARLILRGTMETMEHLKGVDAVQLGHELNALLDSVRIREALADPEKLQDALAPRLMDHVKGVAAMILVREATTIRALLGSGSAALLSAELPERASPGRADATLISRESDTGAISPRWQLTPAERQIAELIMNGARRDEIPQHLGKSVNTVKTLIRRVLQKTGASSMADLAELLRGERRHARTN